MTTSAREIVYSDSTGQALDLYLAPDPRTSPLVAYVHGGGFQRGDKGDHAERLQVLAGLGLNIASINYRLAPTWRHPSQVEDVHAAIAALRQIGPQHGIATAAIGAIGASAGGYLVSAAALSAKDPANSIQAASAWFASSDFAESTRRSELEARISPITYERALLGDDAGPAEFKAASPAHWDLHDAPPFLLVHGDSDKIVLPVQSAVFHDALARQGAETTLIRIGGAGHEGREFDELPTLSMVAGWMRAQLSTGNH